MSKQPRSVQVVVFRQDGPEPSYLLLKRIARYGGHWQTVTGSLEPGETHLAAAQRELAEETGIAASQLEFIDLHVVNTFQIAPEWLHRYPPGVTHNEEVAFAIKAHTHEIRLDPEEHELYCWREYDLALEMIYWESTRRALTATETLLSLESES
jgi:dihydroneopterin triphosphate diphosphatase